MSQIRESRRAALILISPAVLVLLLLNIFPIAFAVYISLRHWSLSSPRPPRFAGWFNYEELTWDDRFINSLWVSATFILIAVLTQLVLGFALAMIFNKKLKGLDALRKLSLLPVMTMPLVVGLVWFYMLNENFGVINWFVTLTGSERLPFLTDKTLAILSIALADVWQWTPFVALVIFAALQSLPEYVFEAGRMDGLTEREIFWRITLPLLRPAIIVVLIIRAIDSFRMIELVFMMTKGGPGGATEVLAYYIYSTGFLSLDLGYAGAMAVIMIIIVTLVAQIFVRQIARPEKS